MTTTIKIDKNGNVRIMGKCGTLFDGKCKIRKSKTGDKMSLELECDLEKVKKKIVTNRVPISPKPPVPICPIDMRYFEPKKKVSISNDKELIDWLLRR